MRRRPHIVGRSRLESMAFSDLGSSCKTEHQILQRASVSISFQTRVHYSRIVKQFVALQNNDKLITLHHQVSTKGVNFLWIFDLILKLMLQNI